MSPYDPIHRHKAMEKLVTRRTCGSQERKYWRFRSDRWYGGIITADAVGCGLWCKFCWVSDTVMSGPEEVGRFYSPESVASTMMRMAKKRGLKQLRISGGEPTIGRNHLVQLLENLDDQKVAFVLETNGLLIGDDQNYAKELSKYPFVHVRVALKGCNEKEFVTLTGSKPEGFALQLKALEYLVKNRVECSPAVMISFSQNGSLKKLIQRIRKIEPSLIEKTELEKLILYPNVRKKINRYGLAYNSGYFPNNVPRALI